MILRDAESHLKEAAAGFPVTAVTGPRQSGKTTLVKHVFGEKPYLNLENLDLRQLAEDGPRGFHNRYKDGAVLDEVQRIPQLLSYLQVAVDETSRPGRFILTGSQQFGLLSGITQTLAGRIALIELLPFTLHECYSEVALDKTLTLDEVLFTGLYPPVHDRKLEPSLWYGNYVRTYVERDVRQMINVRDLSTFRRFVRLCAGRIGQLLNLSQLANDCGITHNTAKAWISILEASYIIYLLHPHHQSFNKRLIKSPKLYFYDSGLACWLLSIRSSEQLSNHSLRGSPFEGFVIGERIKESFNRGFRPELFFWRDRSGNEIDLVIDLGEKLLPVEIKSGQTLNRDYFRGLKRWLSVAGQLAVRPMLVYGGREVAFQSGIDVFPWLDKGWLDL